jgi:hypothetical protein
MNLALDLPPRFLDSRLQLNRRQQLCAYLEALSALSVYSIDSALFHFVPSSNSPRGRFPLQVLARGKLDYQYY